MKRRAFKYILAMVSVAFLMGTAPVQAQQPPPQSGVQQMVKSELQRLRQKIATAYQVLRAYKNAEAEKLVRQAEALAQKAHEMVRQKRYRNAQQTIRQAHKLLNEAMRLALQNPLQRLISRLQLLFRQAESLVIGSGNFEAQRLLNLSRDYHRRAEHMRSNGDYFRALDQYRLAIKYVENALNMVRPREQAAFDVKSDLSDAERMRFEALAERVHEAIRVSRNASARTIYEQALRQARKAMEAYHSGHRQMARTLFNGAYRLLLRALDMAARQSNLQPHYLRSELASLNEMLRQVESKPPAHDDPQHNVLILRVRENLRRARIAIDEDRLPAAQSYLKLSRTLLSRLMRGHQKAPPGNARRVSEELTNLKFDLRQVNQRIRQAQNPQATELLKFARRAARQAQRSYENGRMALALQQVLVAQRFLSRVDAALSEGQPRMNAQRVEATIERLRQMINEIESDYEVSGIMRNLLKQARDMLAQAEKKQTEQHYLVAFELAEIGIEILKKAVRLSNQE
ncbi:MAG: hypothetical protein Q9P14_18475 [candidate division KSB1 bacterium]|nr:hypothetical protein [candidate division KSB1 bacterium]